ncbi:MAG: DUF1501 domain-containing protein [Planctomycetales bacterium]
MLELHDGTSARDCSGASRRDFLKVGALGIAGCGLSPLFGGTPALAAAANADRRKSVVLLFLCGGASHLEMFDPKRGRPGDHQSVIGTVPTAISGVHFGSVYEGLARRADRLAVVRSFAPHGISDHAQAIKHLLTTGDAEGTSIGARFARIDGPSDAATGMPTYAALIQQDEADSQYREDRDRMNVGSRPGGLGSAYAPFAPDGGDLAENMTLRLPLARLDDRRSLLDALDRMRREADRSEAIGALDHLEQQAFDALVGGRVRKALDLSGEHPETVRRYDTSRFQVGWTAKQPSTLGKRLLLARRLVQAGCRFITVGNAGWDNHANANHPNVYHGMHLLGRPLDQALSAFLDDLAEQGLSDDVLLVVTSEFGRTPKLDKNGGRDHWPGVTTLLFAGGGLRMGQVIGETTARGEEPKGEPLGYDALLGTLWHAMFDVGQVRLRQGLPGDLLRQIERAQPIPGLV